MGAAIAEVCARNWTPKSYFPCVEPTWVGRRQDDGRCHLKVVRGSDHGMTIAGCLLIV